MRDAARNAGRSLDSAMTSEVGRAATSAGHALSAPMEAGAAEAGRRAGTTAADEVTSSAERRLRGEGGRFISAGMRGAEPAARSAGERAGRAIGDGMARGVRSSGGIVGGAMKSLTGAIGRTATGGAATLGAGLVAAGGFGLKAAADLEQTRISFDSLTGSAQAGGQTMADLQKFAAATPFEFPQVADAGKRFLAFSKSVGMSRDQMIPFLTTIGDVASVTGGGAEDRKSTRLNSSHLGISYAVFCLKKKTKHKQQTAKARKTGGGRRAAADRRPTKLKPPEYLITEGAAPRPPACTPTTRTLRHARCS